MRNTILVLLGLVWVVTATNASQPTSKEAVNMSKLFISAIEGDPDAMFEMATMLSDSEHGLYHPEKGQEYFLKLARNGDPRVIEPLIDAFVNPKHSSYSPDRAAFYAKRSENISPLKRRFIDFISGNAPSLTLLDTDSSTDPFYSVAFVFSHYPFTNLSTQQWQAMTPHLTQPVMSPYLSYVLPVMYSPSVDGKSLFPASDNNAYSGLTKTEGFYEFANNASNIERVKLVRENGSVKRISVLYPAPDSQSARLAHYANHYQQYFNVVSRSASELSLEGHYLQLSVAIVDAFIVVDFIYPEQPSLRSVDYVG